MTGAHISGTELTVIRGRRVCRRVRLWFGVELGRALYKTGPQLFWPTLCIWWATGATASTGGRIAKATLAGATLRTQATRHLASPWEERCVSPA